MLGQVGLAPCEKVIDAPLINHELTVTTFLEIRVKFHKPYPGVITATTVQSRNPLHRTCLTKWSWLKHLKKQHIMPVWKSCKAISTALGPKQNTARPIIHKWENTWNSGEPSQECPVAYQNQSKSTSMTLPGEHKRTQNNILRPAGLTCLS